MKHYKVKDLMVKLSEYATVSEDANLFEAIMALEKAQQEFDPKRYRHRAILVYNKDEKVVGKLSMLDVISCLEPKYKEIGDPAMLSRAGFNAKFLQDMRKQYSLWDKPLRSICQKGTKLKIRDFMYTPTEGEYVDADSTLDEGIHRLVVGRHQSLLVTNASGEIVGVLRLTDVFSKIVEAIKECEIETSG